MDGLFNDNEWNELNSIDVYELFEKLAPLKKKLCLLLKNKKLALLEHLKSQLNPFKSMNNRGSQDWKMNQKEQCKQRNLTTVN